MECYSGYRAEQEPRRIVVDGRAIEVAEILDRWLAPDHRYFKVLGADGRVYMLRHDTEWDEWELRE